jgi:hypothetical protein
MYVDLLTINRSFYVGSMNTFKTSLGGILSILFVVILIPVTFYISYDFILGKNPSLQKYSAVTRDGWDNVTLNVMVSYPKELLNSSYLFIWSDEEDKYMYNFTECTESNYTQFTNETREEEMTYQCLSLASNLHDLWIDFGNCNKIEDIGYTHDNITTCLTNYTGPEYITNFTVYVEMSRFNSSAVQQPVQKDVFKGSMSKDKNLIEMNYDTVKAENDLGVFFPYIDTYYFHSMDWLGHGFEELSFSFAEVIIRPHKNLNICKTYIRLQMQIAKVLTIIKILYLAFTFTNWNDYFYCKQFLKLYISQNLLQLRDIYREELKKYNICKYKPANYSNGE